MAVPISVSVFDVDGSPELNGGMSIRVDAGVTSIVSTTSLEVVTTGQAC